MRAFWGVGTNVGDTLTPVILEHFTKHKAEWVSSLEDNKLLMCGSILEFAKPGDIVLGAGTYSCIKKDLHGVDVRALRGVLSGQAPAYGDPGVLLPLIYKPNVKKDTMTGFIPHLWDQRTFQEGYIDVNLPWKEFVKAILKCDNIVTSSLHGAVIADAYGVPCEWIESPIVPGARIKYADYLTSMSKGLDYAQDSLLKALENL